MEPHDPLLSSDQVLQILGACGVVLAAALAWALKEAAHYIQAKRGQVVDQALNDKLDTVAARVAKAVEEWARRRWFTGNRPSSEEKLELAVEKANAALTAKERKSIPAQVLRDTINAQVNSLRPEFAVSASIRPGQASFSPPPVPREGLSASEAARLRDQREPEP